MDTIDFLLRIKSCDSLQMLNKTPNSYDGQQQYFVELILQFLIGLQNLYICAVYLVFIFQVKKRVRILTCDKNSTTFLDENCSRKTAHLLSRLSDNKKIKSLSFSLGNTCSNVTDCEMEPEADPE